MAQLDQAADAQTAVRVAPLGRPRMGLVVRLDTDGVFEALLISAVATILIMRGYLQAMGYPQIGGGGLHIAHMLWGGLIMLAAIVVLVAFVGAPARRIGAVAAGIGFGLFIDELGKFITSDNNYFFQPTVGLLYLIFVSLFLVFRFLDQYEPRSRVERLTNVADALSDLVFRDAPGTYRRAKLLLENAAGHDDLTQAMQRILQVTHPTRADELDPRSRRGRAFAAYERFRASAWFSRGVTLLFFLNALLNFLVVLVVMLLLGAVAIGGVIPSMLVELAGEGDLGSWIGLGILGIGSILALVCTVQGMLSMRTSRLVALRWFQRSVVVSLLLVQPISFFTDSFGGLTGLAVNLVLWLGLGFLIHQEITRRARLEPGEAR